MTPQATHSDKKSGTVLLAKQIVDYSKPQLLAVWKELNPSEYEPTTRKDLQIYFIQRLSDSHEHVCTPVPFAINSDALLPASGASPGDSPPSTSKPADDLPQRLSYSKVVQSSSVDTDCKLLECEKRLLVLEKAAKAYDHKLEEIERNKKSLNLVMYNIPEEEERAKTKAEEANDSAMAYMLAVGNALSKAGAPDEEVTTVVQSIAPAGVERIGRFVADRNKPRPIRVLFNKTGQKHTILSYAKDLRQAGIRVDDDLTRVQQTERRGLDLDFKILKGKGYQPYFRGSLLKYYSGNKNHTCAKGKADRILAAP